MPMAAFCICSMTVTPGSSDRSLPLAGGLAAVAQSHARSALAVFIFINKLDAGSFKSASDLIQY
jgi:hypothetical protein